MKRIKLFALALTALFTTSIYAQDTLFYWRSSAATSKVESATAAIKGTYIFTGSANPGSENAAYVAGVPDGMKSTTTKGNKLGSSTLYFAATLDGTYKLQAGDTIYVCGYNPYKIGSTVSSNTAGTDIASSLATGADKDNYNIGKVGISAAMIASMGTNISTVYFSRALGSGTGLAAIMIVRPAPNTEPVSTVTVTGLAKCFVGRNNSLEASCDKPADEYLWEVDGVEQTGATTSSFVFSSNSEGTFAIVCKAKNSFNSDWVASSAFSVQVLPPYSQVDVDGSITWDWTKAASVASIQFSDATTPKKGDTILLANVDNMKNDANFNSQALLFAGEYTIRDSKYCQGSLLKFHTLVAGKLQVIYSNTGNRSNESERRFLTVNSTQVGSGSMKSDKNDTISGIVVAAGDVSLVGVFNNGDPAAAPQYLRFYKVVFQPSFAVTCADAEHGTVTADMSAAVEGEKVTLTLTPESGYEVASVAVNGNALTPEAGVYSFDMPGEAANVVATFSVASALDNTDAGVKAVKVIRDGQLLIEKGGVLYNAQGAVIR